MMLVGIGQVVFTKISYYLEVLNFASLNNVSLDALQTFLADANDWGFEAY